MPRSYSLLSSVDTLKNFFSSPLDALKSVLAPSAPPAATEAEKDSYFIELNKEFSEIRADIDALFKSEFHNPRYNIYYAELFRERAETHIVKAFKAGIIDEQDVKLLADINVKNLMKYFLEKSAETYYKSQPQTTVTTEQQQQPPVKTEKAAEAENVKAATPHKQFAAAQASAPIAPSPYVGNMPYIKKQFDRIQNDITDYINGNSYDAMEASEKKLQFQYEAQAYIQSSLKAGTIDRVEAKMLERTGVNQLMDSFDQQSYKHNRDELYARMEKLDREGKLGNHHNAAPISTNTVSGPHTQKVLAEREQALKQSRDASYERR